MKRTASLFFVALLAGTVTLGAYKLFFEKDSKTVVTREATPFVTTGLSTSAKGAGYQ